jgi:hypothetical protein
VGKMMKRLRDVKLLNIGDSIRNTIPKVASKTDTTASRKKNRITAIKASFPLKNPLNQFQAFLVDAFALIDMITSPTKPTANSHHAIEAPKTDGGNETANPTNTIGRKRTRFNAAQMVYDFGFLNT